MVGPLDLGTAARELELHVTTVERECELVDHDVDEHQVALVEFACSLELDDAEHTTIDDHG